MWFIIVRSILMRALTECMCTGGENFGKISKNINDLQYHLKKAQQDNHLHCNKAKIQKNQEELDTLKIMTLSGDTSSNLFELFSEMSLWIFTWMNFS